jgi:uracil-DNA glycosylase
MPNLRAIVTLGRIAHDTVMTGLGAKRSGVPFGHACAHDVGALRVFDSYHCSRYNTNTGVLTPDMFRTVFSNVRAYLDTRNQATTSSAFLSGGKTG